MFPEEHQPLLTKEPEKIEELTGKLRSDFKEDKLMRSVLANDKDTIDDGKILNEALNRGLQSFTPDLLFQQMVQNYTHAERILGERLISLLAGYDSNYVKKNLNIPEFRRELKGNIAANINKLREEGLIDKEGIITEKGVELASLVLYVQEMEKIIPHGYLGEKIHKKKTHYGEKGDVRIYRKGDRYKDLSIKKSVHLAVRRGHADLQALDLKVQERKSKGTVYLIYALDASGSMKGNKIDVCKKAGVSLAYKAISEKDPVGLIVFGSEISEEVAPTLNFGELLKKIAVIKATKETNFPLMVEKAITLFPKVKATKHLVILTDAQPTVGENPREHTLKAVSEARAYGITISLIGINLDKEAVQFAQDIISIGEGRLYLVKDLDKLDQIVLEDYCAVM
ncbi:MAG TPA: VWA domain-containing protein [Candidatus Nanoarchaeia archaeon]|nr:VWA domain-containing protein [Candidatus Nanoarchaeia archaeon]